MKYYKKLHPAATNSEFKRIWDALDNETKEVFSFIFKEIRSFLIVLFCLPCAIPHF